MVFRFRANGVQYSWAGLSLNDSTGAAILHNKNFAFPNGDGYLLFWQDMSSNKFNDLRIAITKDTGLTKSKYTFQNQSSYYTGLLRLGLWNSARTNVAGADYLNASPSDFISVTIKEISNGFISGEFKALLTDYVSPHDKMNITEGLFKNLKIIE